jgi:hypothetical protein
VLPPAGIYLSENGITLAIKPYREGAEKFAVLEEVGLG